MERQDERLIPASCYPGGAWGCECLRDPHATRATGRLQMQCTPLGTRDERPVLRCRLPGHGAGSPGKCRARTLPSGVLVVLDEACQAKVGHFADQVLSHEDVGRPEVSVDVVHPLHVGHAGGDLWGPAHGAPRLAG